VPGGEDTMIELTIYSRPGCHLCRDMKALVDRVAQDTGMPVRIAEINVESDPELEARYGTQIPVLLVDGKKAAKYRVSERELMRILITRKAGEAAKAG
jgi:thiol-disulfide isomerase/thioredoxin